MGKVLFLAEGVVKKRGSRKNRSRVARIKPSLEVVL